MVRTFSRWEPSTEADLPGGGIPWLLRLRVLRPRRVAISRSGLSRATGVICHTAATPKGREPELVPESRGRFASETSSESSSWRRSWTAASPGAGGVGGVSWPSRLRRVDEYQVIEPGPRSTRSSVEFKDALGPRASPLPGI
jgi:hypothetical protein